jgi:hypothetical protein
LKQKIPSTGRDDAKTEGPPAKRQKRIAASKPRAQPQQQQGRQQQQHKSALQRTPAAGREAANQNGLEDNDEEDLSQPAAAEAYSQLVGLLSTRRTALGAALKQRQLQEQEGASEEDESEFEDEEEDSQVSIALQY